MNVKRAACFAAVLGLTSFPVSAFAQTPASRPDAPAEAGPAQAAPFRRPDGPNAGGGFGGARSFGGGAIGGGGFGGSGQGGFGGSGGGMFNGSSSFGPGGRDPLSAEIDRAVMGLGKLKKDADKETMKARLNQLLEDQFEQRQKKHEAEIAELEAQVKKLKELVQTRKDNRKEIVSRRLEQLVRDSQGLAW